MERKILLEHALQRGHLLTIKTNWYRDYLKNKIIPLISEDFEKGDLTTDLLIKKDYLGDAVVIQKQSGIMAGLEEAEILYNQFGIKASSSVKDGSMVSSGDIILRLKGSIKSLLKTERTILDIISRMSGIATMTYNLRKSIKDKISVAATRKTLLPYLDKKAVFIGGGLTHRLALWDGILIKNNHLYLTQKNTSLNDIFAHLIKERHKVIEAEVSNQKQALEVILAYNKYKSTNKAILIIMFDNMSPLSIRKIIRSFNSGKIQRKGHFENNRLLFEASGNITENNIKGYINTGIDFVSLGILTHSVKALDIAQKIICQ